MKIKDEITACRMTYKLWMKLYKWCRDNTGLCLSRYEKSNAKTMIAEVIKPDMRAACPCCQYENEQPKHIKRDCFHCPMFGFWTDNDELYDVDDKFDEVSCQLPTSPYKLWTEPSTELLKNEQIEQVIDAAYDVAMLAKEAMLYWEAMKEMNITW